MAGISAQFADYDKRTPLHLAASEGHASIAELLMVNGAKLEAKDRFGRTPVDDAMNNGHRNVLEVFRAFGAEIPDSAVEVFSREKYELGMQLIDQCAAGNAAKVAELLVHEAPVNFVDYDLRTPLHLAVTEGYTEIVELLLEAGALTNCKDRWNSSPLDEAIHRDATELVALLQSAQQKQQVAKEVAKEEPAPDCLGDAI